MASEPPAERLVDESTAPQRRSFQTKDVRVLAVVCLVTVPLALAFVVWLAFLPPPMGPIEWVIVALILLVGLLQLPLRRCRVIVLDEALHVFGLFGDERYPWTSVRSVYIATAAWPTWGRIPILRLNDGSRKSLTGLFDSSFLAPSSSATMEEAVEVIRAMIPPETALT